MRYTTHVKRTYLLAAAFLLLLPAVTFANPIIEAGKSFWTFDAYRPYSINFLWGPQIGFTEYERGRLYAALPPTYESGTFAVNVFLTATLILIVGVGLLRKTPHRLLMLRSASLLFVAWIIMDIRMGSEFLSWVGHDHRTYIGADSNERTFRDRGRFYDFAEYAKQFLVNRDEYVFFARQPWPYLGNIRYLTYPSIPGIDYKNDDTWVVYDRPDMTVDADNRITISGEPVTPPGTMLGRFDASSFVFRVIK